MHYYCEACKTFIKSNSKYKHFKSNTHKQFERCKHIELSIENPSINDIDRLFFHTLWNKIKNVIIILLNFKIN